MKIMIQIGIIFGVCWLGEGIAMLLPFPFPSSVIAMIILFLLLLTKALKVDHIRLKAEFLQKNMAFFFIPASVGIMENFDLLKANAIPLVTIAVISTVLTFGSAGLTVKYLMRLQEKIRGGKQHDRVDV